MSKSSAPVADSGPELIGREAELNFLARMVDRLESGGGSIVVIEGEPGIGKSALLHQVATDAVARGVRVVRRAPTELEQQIPFGLLDFRLHIDGQTGAIVAAPEPDSGEEVPGVPILTMVNTKLAELRRLTASAPILIVIDDLQWVDPSSLSVLGRLAPVVENHALMLVVATRPWPRGEGMSSVLSEFDAAGASRMSLAPLTDVDLATIVHRVLGAPPDSELLALAAGASGNPAYLIALITGLMRAGLVEVAVGEAGSDQAGAAPRGLCGPLTGELPAPVAEAVAGRLEFLPDSVRHWLEVAAVLRPQVDTVELAAVLGLPVIDVWNAVRTAIETRVLMRTGDQLVFRHEVVRRVLAHQVPPSTRAALIRRAAAVLISLDAPVEQIAYYLLADREPPTAWMVEWLSGSASALLARDPEVAADLLTRSVWIIEIDPAVREQLQVQLGRALIWSGRAADAETALRAALHDARGSEVEASLRWLLAQALYEQARLPAVIAEVRIALAQQGLSNVDRARFHGMYGLALYFLERDDQALTEAVSALEFATESGDATALGYARMALGAVRLSASRLQAATELADLVEESYEIASRTGERVGHFDPNVLRGHTLIGQDRLAEADRVLAVAVLDAQQHHGVYLGVGLLGQARVHFLDGRWDLALEEVRACAAVPNAPQCEVAARGIAALIAAHRGELDAERVEIGDGPASLRVYAGYRPWARALVAESQGRPEEAIELLLGLAAPRPGALSDLMVLEACPDAARLAMLTGNMGLLTAIVDWVDKLLVEHSTASRQATGLLCRGLAEERADLVAEAVVAFRRGARPLYVAQAQENLAVLLARSGRLEEARAAFDAAVTGYQSLAAHWDVARAEARLRPFGLRRGRRGVRRRPKSGWEALTATEQKVAVLVAHGNSNPEIATQMFLSPRTVQTHVSSILAKLGLQSRVQVAVEYARRAS